MVSLLLLLQTRGQMTAAELADELEVSIRTVYRDVDALGEAGVPIYAERGPHGGVRLVEGYRTRLTGLTTEEAEALFLSGLPGPAAELGLGTVVTAARLKVLAALPPELRSRATRISERFHLDAPGWFRTAEAVPHLELLATAVWGNRAVAIEYDRGKQIVTRTLEPLGLVLKGGVWYLVAQAGAGRVRTYRVSRVRSAILAEERFERPERFNLARYWSDSITAYERERPRLDVTFRVSPDALERFAGMVGQARMEEARRRSEPDPDGWVRIQLRFDWLDEPMLLVFEMGGSVEVIDPEHLRSKVIESARAILATYRGEGSRLA
jgi:predicted DNA-binding transcriptional regulator YafY